MVRVRACVRVRAFVRSFVRSCVHACVCVRACVRWLKSLTSGAEGTKKFLGGKLSGSTWKSEAGVTGAAALLFNTSTYLPLAPEEDKTKKIEHGCERTRITQKVITASSQQLAGSGNWRNGKVGETKVSVVEITRKHDKIGNQVDNAIA